MHIAWIIHGFLLVIDDCPTTACLFHEGVEKSHHTRHGVYTYLHYCTRMCVRASSAFYQAFKISLFNFCALQTSLIFNSPTFCFHNICFQGVLDMYTPNIDAMLWQAMCGHKLMAV